MFPDVLTVHLLYTSFFKMRIQIINENQPIFYLKILELTV